MVLADGTIMTKAERIAQIKAEHIEQMKGQQARTVTPPSREVTHRYGDVYVLRYLTDGEWILQVWAKENGQWKAAAVQMTAAKK